MLDDNCSAAVAANDRRDAAQRSWSSAAEVAYERSPVSVVTRMDDHAGSSEARGRERHFLMGSAQSKEPLVETRASSRLDDGLGGFFVRFALVGGKFIRGSVWVREQLPQATIFHEPSDRLRGRLDDRRRSRLGGKDHPVEGFAVGSAQVLLPWSVQPRHAAIARAETPG